jgi:hypothetical protein
VSDHTPGEVLAMVGSGMVESVDFPFGPDPLRYYRDPDFAEAFGLFPGGAHSRHAAADHDRSIPGSGAGC